MAREAEVAFDDIISINHSNTNGRFEVRVVRKWGVIDHSRPGVFGLVEMVLMDKHLHKIQATIPNDVLSVFDEQVQEGRVYVMSDFTVVPSDNHTIPMYVLSLIGADNVLEKKENFKYLVDVVGVVSHVQHDKNFYFDGRVTSSVSFRLNDQRKSFPCELHGVLDDEFKDKVKCCSDGLPIVVLQFARIVISQGSVLVEGVERVTKILVNPNVVEVINFRNGLLLYLGRTPNYGGLIHAKQRLRLSHNLDFIEDHPVKNIAELNTDPQLGVFIVNARMIDILSLDPWWYPMCKCGVVFEDYIGDETGCAQIKTFNHLMADLAVIDPYARVISADDFYKSFYSIMGKSIMWIVKKTTHAPEFVGCSCELLRVTNGLAIIDYFKEKGLYKTSSKVVEKTLLTDKKGNKVINCLPFTTTTSDLVDQYFYAAFPLPS
ncbi:hypothetical protein TSUD_58360 [Trifolium subterraneum]|uniref:Replication protein A 70 kDa DNA-binding subunit B/D first OB fold domain-containing protein n=1 Tax=Trifolium subterraneum TaxID=3900 RepID=A0A2Z6N7H8_TRISU|nr:hypothetical protein TSUD_58360 [Trifolium subterraneum]